MIIDFEVADFQPITVGSSPVGISSDKLKRGNDGDYIIIRNLHTAKKLSMRRMGNTDAVIMVSYLESRNERLAAN